MTKQEYEKKLDELLDKIFAASKHMTMEELAAAAELNVNTVLRIDQRITRLPRMKSVIALARAVGLDLDVVAPRAKAAGKTEVAKPARKANARKEVSLGV